MPRITITLAEQKIKVSYPYGLLYRNVAFSFDKIVYARVANLNDVEVRKFITPCYLWRRFRRTNVRLLCNLYQYAIFLRDRQPLPDGHQAVDLKLKNGRHVLLETDDAENFLAALRIFFKAR